MARARGNRRQQAGDAVVIEGLEERLLLSETWRFMVFADTQGTADPINSAIVGELAKAAVREGVDLILVPGDLTYQGGTRQFKAWRKAMKPAYKAGIDVYPLRGDHDYDAASFLRVLGKGIPRNGPHVGDSISYSFTHRNATFIAIDEISPDSAPIDHAWLKQQLLANDQPNIFVYGHKPAFKLYHADSVGYNRPGDRDAFWREISGAGVKAYFCGHEHFYDNTRLDDGDGNAANDVHQLIVGTGGGPLYANASFDGDNGAWTPVRLMHDQSYGYLLAEVSGDWATMTWKHRTAADVYESADVFTHVGDPVGHPPLANPDTVRAQANTRTVFDVVANDTDAVDPQMLGIVSFTKPSGCKVTLNGDGTFTITAKKNFSGATSFTYTIRDSHRGMSSTTVSILVNARPIARGDSVATPLNTPATFDVLANDKDLDGGTLSIIGFTQPKDGTLTLNADGTFTYTRAGRGLRSFTYTVSDGQGGQATAKVRLR